MLFNSLRFVLFFPAALLVFHVLPKRVRAPWLLLCSYFFYMSWSPRYALLLLFSTGVTYLAGLGMDRIARTAEDEKKARTGKRWVLGAAVCLNFAVLFLFKYFGFFENSLTALAARIGWNLTLTGWRPLLPVGISFFTFQAVGYAIDVYRGDTKAERNLLRYALFVSFFPQLVAGPIERSGKLLGQLADLKRPTFERARHGFLLMLWGYFLKMVLADRIALFVDTVYGAWESYPGAYIGAATVLFAFQIYCDFAGYSTIAVGAAEMLGVGLTENFRSPYLAPSVGEFWKRWHISLTSWFRDYVYIPLGGNRKGKARAIANRMAVFLLSGLWHGADWSFVAWGALNGLYATVGDLTSGWRAKLARKTGGGKNSLAGRILGAFITFVLIDFSWIFFRAEGVREAFGMIRSLVGTRNPWVLFDGSLLDCGLDGGEFVLLGVGLLVLFAADLLAVRGVRVSEVIGAQPVWFRWPVMIGAVLAILVFGVWGTGYNAASFIYFQF